MAWIRALGFLGRAGRVRARPAHQMSSPGRSARPGRRPLVLLRSSISPTPQNEGISLGLLNATNPVGRWMLVAVTSAIAIAVAVWIGREKNRSTRPRSGWCSAVRSAISSTDAATAMSSTSLDLHFGELRPFLVFNVGDAAISIGVVILLLRAFLTRKDEGPAPRRQSNMRKAFTALVLVAAVATSGCAALRPRRPDEFAVARNAPLIIPPDFTWRRRSPAPPGCPPRRPAAGDRRFVRRPGAAQRGRNQPARRCRTRHAPVGIRSTAWDPDTRIVDKGPTTLQIPRRRGEQQHRLKPRPDSNRLARLMN